MNLFLVGNEGQLGSRLHKILENDDFFKVHIWQDIKINPEKDKESLKLFIIHNKIDLIINAAAYTKVDLAESEKKLCSKINVSLPLMLANLSNELDITLLHYSTDYVFDGSSTSPYAELSTALPINFYGESKFLGEKAILENTKNALIIRVSWLYDLNNISSFPRKIIKLAAQKDCISVVDDQISAPTSTSLIAEETAHILKNFIKIDLAKQRIFHISPNGKCSWYDFAKKILDHSGLVQKRIVIKKIKSEDLNLPASRPKFSKLNSDLYKDVFGDRLPSWEKDFQNNATDFAIHKS